jgi:hypothetical protein
MCGPSAAQTSLSGQSQSLSSLLSANYAQNFGAQSPILGNLTSILTPIAEAGPSQEGMSPAEKAAITGNAINTTAANYKNAATVIGTGRAGAGGNTYAPSGADTQVQGEIASEGAQQLSGEENQIEQADYALGHKNFEEATGGLETTAAAYNPNAIASTAVGANQSAFGEQSQIQSEDNAWMGDVAGLVGGLGGAALGNPSLFKPEPGH